MPNDRADSTADRRGGAINGRRYDGRDPFHPAAPGDSRAPRAVLTEELREPDPAVAFPTAMLAHHLGAEPGDEIALYVTDPAKWDALRAFGVRYGLNVVAPNPVTEREGTRFEEIDAVPPDVATMLCPDLDGTTRAEVAEFVAESALYDIPEPEAALNELRARADARKRDRGQRQQKLRKVSVAPHTAYALAEVERGCGSEVADAARQMIERQNRDTWNMGPAARKHRREEHNYLATAAELVGLDVPVEAIAALTAATAGDRSAAWAELADARALHKAGGVTVRDSVAKRWRTLDDLDNLPGTAWLVGKLLPAASLTHLVGMSQSLKSFIALDMALSLATGTPFAGAAKFVVAEPVPVLYVVGEGAGGIGKRVRAWCEQRGIDRRRVLANFMVLEGAAQLGSPRDMDDVRAKVEETGARLVVFDTQARCTVGLEENSATDQGRAVAHIDTLMRRTGTAVLVLHHTTKADPRNARGSVAWLNAVDVQLLALRDSPKSMEVTIEVGKMKDDAVEGPYPLTAVKVSLPGGGDSLVIAPGADPLQAPYDPDLPMDKWTGTGAAFVKQMYALAQEGCIPGEGLTQTRLAEMANEEIGQKPNGKGGMRKVRRVCSRHTATGAVKLLVAHQKLVVAKRDPFGHVFYEPVDYPPLDPAAMTALTGDGSGDTDTAPPT
ncbi:AAA family ATPase [Mycobacterium sp. 29Ha]|uniref:AAA family ATPase n=1 Tax=Mycobacterium sp. 29Ha TaxID=2939268 RepID=UPI002938F8F7|nr:AAA family ATPase [Mycobacterium sp. 29Ha]MDV3135409.1 helicase RepA family protein [Mycobacterium sp. 29Ha]